jgi:hypothetical protein
MKLKKTTVRLMVRVIIVLLFGVSQAGCEYAVTTAVTGVSMGIAYLYMSVAERTVSFDLNRMGRASVMALNKMGISIRDQFTAEGETKIWAKAKDLDITIKLKEITAKSTKMKVDARHVIIKDKATALEIIRQTVELAEELSHKERAEASYAI